MRRWHRRTTRLLVALVAALLAASVGSGALRSTATTVGVGLQITASESSVGLTVGAQAVIAVTVSEPGSLLGPIGLSVTGAPIGATLSYPGTVLSGVPAVITVFANASTKVGTYYLQITATSGTSTQSITVALVVSLPTGFTMVMNPSSRTVVDGESTSFALSINRGLLAGPIALKVSGVPQFATATVSPSLSILGSSATIDVSTATNVVPGIYLITVKGTALLASATASAYLIVTPQTYPDFTISGSPVGVLTPGGPTLPINLAITNPFGSAMTVAGLGVTVTGTDKPGCDAGNYQVNAYSGPGSLVIPAHSTKTLQDLSVPTGNWPTLQMVNQATNQDSCKGATVQLHYSGSGSGY